MTVIKRLLFNIFHHHRTKENDVVIRHKVKLILQRIEKNTKVCLMKFYKKTHLRKQSVLLRKILFVL